MKIKSGKKLMTSLIALLLSFIFLLPQNVMVFAATDSDSSQDIDNFIASIDFLIPEEVDEVEALRAVLGDLSPEAMDIFLSFLVYDDAARETYQLYVDPSFQPVELNTISFGVTAFDVASFK